MIVLHAILLGVALSVLVLVTDAICGRVSERRKQAKLRRAFEDCATPYTHADFVRDAVDPNVSTDELLERARRLERAPVLAGGGIAGLSLGIRPRPPYTCIWCPCISATCAKHREIREEERRRKEYGPAFDLDWCKHHKRDLRYCPLVCGQADFETRTLVELPSRPPLEYVVGSDDSGLYCSAFGLTIRPGEAASREIDGKVYSVSFSENGQVIWSSS